MKGEIICCNLIEERMKTKRRHNNNRKNRKTRKNHGSGTGTLGQTSIEQKYIQLKNFLRNIKNKSLNRFSRSRTNTSLSNKLKEYKAVKIAELKNLAEQYKNCDNCNEKQKLEERMIQIINDYDLGYNLDLVLEMPKQQRSVRSSVH